MSDIAHRAALLYAFAIGLIAVFAELSTWPTWVDLSAVLVLVLFFVAAIASYQWHGMRGDTDDQMRGNPSAVACFMGALVVGEVGGFLSSCSPGSSGPGPAEPGAQSVLRSAARAMAAAAGLTRSSERPAEAGGPMLRSKSSARNR